MDRDNQYSRRKAITSIPIGIGLVGLASGSATASEVSVGEQWVDHHDNSRQSNPRSSSSLDMYASSHLAVEKTGEDEESDDGTDYIIHELEICGIHSSYIENERVPDDCDSYGGRGDPRCSAEIFQDPFLNEYGLEIEAGENVGLSGSLTTDIGIDGGPAYEEENDEISDQDRRVSDNLLTLMDLASLALTKSNPVGAAALTSTSIALSLMTNGQNFDNDRGEEIAWNTGSSPESVCYCSNHRNIDVWVPEAQDSGSVTITAFSETDTTTYAGNLAVSASETIDF